MNLYGMLNNKILNGVDYIGLDCILVADRPVGGTGGDTTALGYHYAIEYWKGCCPPKGREFNISAYKRMVIYSGAGKHGFVDLGKVELLNTSGYRAYKKSEIYDEFGNESTFWIYGDVPISVINYGFKNNPTSTSAANVFEGDPDVVREKWNSIIDNSKSYRYAEQDGFSGRFNNFPYSVYPPMGLGTNSNTFVREMLRLVGIKMVELGGLHPGPDRPKHNEPHFRLWSLTRPK